MNLTHPERILQIHRAYLTAGAMKIKTNTFSSFPSAPGQTAETCVAQVRAAWQISHDAIAGVADLADSAPSDLGSAPQPTANSHASIVADIGPHPLSGSVELTATIRDEYKGLAAALLQQGAEEFLFETQDNLEDLLPAIAHIQETKPTAKITVSFTVNPLGYTKAGFPIRDLLTQAESTPAITYTGLNCDLGPTHLVRIYLENASFPKLQFLSPNSGQPERDLGRGRTAADASYFASCFAPALAAGLTQIGGCCGTNPLDVEALVALAKATPIHPKPRHTSPIPSTSGPSHLLTSANSPDSQPDSQPEANSQPDVKSPWYQRLLAGNKVIAVEYDTPQTVRTTAYYRGLRELLAAGVDLLTFADSPVGRARMDSSLMATQIKANYPIDTLPHLTCRDRNLNATRALLLGLAASGVNQVLIVTGDPLPLDLRQEIKTVFNTDSIRLLSMISDLNRELVTSSPAGATVGSASGATGSTVPPFILCAALNVNARNFAPELKRAEQKVAAGASVFFTQPIFTERAAANLALAKETLPTAHFMAGIMPVVSHKNALYLRHEMSGMDIPDSLVARYESLNRQEAEAVAIEVSLQLMSSLDDLADGFYLMTPFQRTGLIAQILDQWHSTT